MKKVLLTSVGVMFSLFFLSCSSEDELQVAKADTNSFYGRFSPSINEDGTRAYVNPADRTTIWGIGDAVGVFATSGPQQSQIEFVVQEVLEGGSACKFTPGSYFNRPGFEFVSYYPLQEKFLRYNSDIELSLAGQSQAANDNASKVSEHIFYVTDPCEPLNETTFDFAYNRFWALAYTDFTMPKAGTWTKFTLKAPAGKYFHENIKYNFAKDGGAGITQSDNASSITLTLGENGEGITTAAGENLKLFMFICPTDMEGQDLIAEVQDNNGIVYSCVISGMSGSNPRTFFATNTNYRLAGSPVKSGNIDDITGTGRNFNPMRTE